MAVEFTIIRNPNRLLFKHEVWVKGNAVYTDKFGQAREGMDYCRPAVSFITAKGAEGFVAYQQVIATL
jgi:hypothetical protein